MESYPHPLPGLLPRERAKASGRDFGNPLVFTARGQRKGQHRQLGGQRNCDAHQSFKLFSRLKPTVETVLQLLGCRFRRIGAIDHIG